MAAFEDDVILSGVMLKKGHIVKNWKERFVVLSSNSLEYFEDSTKRVRKGEVPITDATEVEGRVGSSHEFKFTIRTGPKNLTMAATSAEMREQWTQAVRRLVDLKVSSLNVKALSSSGSNGSSVKQPAVAPTRLRRNNKATNAPAVDVASESTASRNRMQEVSPDSAYRRQNTRSLRIPTSPITPPRSRSASQPSCYDFKTELETVDTVKTDAGDVSPTPPAPVAQAAITTEVDDDGWERVDSPEGTYYYHKKTRVSRWDKPDRSVSAAVNNRIQDTERTADSAFQVKVQYNDILHFPF